MEPRYHFDESEPAARRLELVHAVFEATSGPFLRVHAPAAPELAVDLGCGPGVCTRFLATVTGAARAVGLDASERFVALASQLEGSPLDFRVHDVSKVPFPVGPADLLYCRLLLIQLPDPAEMLRRWASQLRLGGRLMIEEVESIHTAHPTFQAYLELVAAVIAHKGKPLYIGPLLETLAPAPGVVERVNLVTPLEVDNTHAAQMFGWNLQSWKTDPFVRTHYPAAWLKELEADLREMGAGPPGRRDTEWGVRQLVWERTVE
jgi:trans-aconitate 2-methyltransferase